MSASLDQLFALYRESFPASERRSEEDLRAALSGSDYLVLSREDAGQIIGFAMIFVPAAKHFALLEYLAVAPNRRSAGLGRKLVEEAIEATRGRSLLIEIESQTADPTSARRQTFYEKCNFNRIAGVKYQLPLPGNPPPMELWAHPASESSPNRKQLELWLRTIYVQVYHCLPDDLRIEQMMANIPV